MGRLYSLLLLFGRLQDLEGAQKGLVYTHHRSSVVEFATVVWSGEEGDELALGEELVTILHDLMSTAYQVHIVFLQEAGNDIGSEGERHAAIVFTPACDIFIWVRPEQIAE